MFESFTEEARSVVEDAADYAQRLGATSVGTEHILLGLLGAQRSRRSGPLFARGITADTLMPALLDHLGKESLPAPAAQRPTSLTPQALRAFQAADRASGDAKVDTTALLQALLDLPGWSGYDVLRQAGVDPGVPASPGSTISDVMLPMLREGV